METNPTLSLEGAVLVGTLFREHRSRVFKYLVKNLKDRDIAEDVTSDVFIKVAESIAKGGYKERRMSKPWVMKIAHNEMMNFFRSIKIKKIDRREDHSQGIQDKNLNPEERLVRFQLHESVTSIIDKLPKVQKELVMLRMHSGMSFEEISKMIGVQNTTLRVQHHKAIINLRRLVESQRTGLDEYRTPN